MSTVHSIISHVFPFLDCADMHRARLVSSRWACQEYGTFLFRNMSQAISALERPKYRWNTISLTSTERGIGETFEQLSKVQKIARGVHLGVSTLHNWDYIFSTRSQFAILIDENVYVCQLNSMAVDCLRISNSRIEFESVFMVHFLSLTYLSHQNLTSEALGYLAWKVKPYSAMHTEEGFRYLRELALGDRIIVITGSLEDEGVMTQITDAVERAGLAFTSMYLTNGYKMLELEGEEGEPKETAFKKNMERLIGPKTAVIDASMYYDKDDGLFFDQSISFGKDYVPLCGQFKKKEE